MLSGRAVGVTRFDDEAATDQRTFHIDDQTRRPALQVGRHQELDVSHGQSLVGIEVLAFCVGVDRHLSWFASTNRCNEVEGDPPALLASQFDGGFCDVDVHTASL